MNRKQSLNSSFARKIRRSLIKIRRLWSKFINRFNIKRARFSKRAKVKLRKGIVWCFKHKAVSLGAGAGVVVAVVLTVILVSALNGGTAQAYSYNPDDAPEVVMPSPSAATEPDPSATPEPTPEPTPYKLAEGMDAPEVIELQVRLMELGYMEDDEPIEHFGPMTKEAVEKFQKKNALSSDGVCGEQTKALLFSEEAKKYTVDLGDSGEDVKDLRERLKELGYLEKATDRFDETTQEAVKKFQERNDLSADGRVGALTREILYSDKARPDVIGKGLTGDKVLKLQNKLKQLGYLTTVPDGNFGSDTVNAVKHFQGKAGLIPDGNVGPATSEALYSNDAPINSVSLGDSGSDVTNVQKRLIQLNYLSGKSDGYFGSGTEKAVKSFQKNNKLTQDGKVGKNTMNVLLSSNAKKATSSSGSAGNGKKNSGGNSGGSSGQPVPAKPDEASVNALLEFAKSRLGKKYVRGAKGPDSFDCSGFVYWCLKSIGVNQSYLTSSGWAACTKYPVITNINDLAAGDIIVVKGHVGIYMGGGQIIDASSSNGKVRTCNLSDWWKRNFKKACRVL